MLRVLSTDHCRSVTTFGFCRNTAVSVLQGARRTWGGLRLCSPVWREHFRQLVCISCVLPTVPLFGFIFFLPGGQGFEFNTICRCCRKVESFQWMIVILVVGQPLLSLVSFLPYMARLWGDIFSDSFSPCPPHFEVLPLCEPPRLILSILVPTRCIMYMFTENLYNLHVVHREMKLSSFKFQCSQSVLYDDVYGSRSNMLTSQILW